MHSHNHNHNHEHQAPRRSLSDFLPLVIIFSIVIALTLVTLLLRENILLQDALRFFMGYFFLIFGGFKIVRWRGFAEAYNVYDLIAMRVRMYGYVYPLIELSLAALFLSGIFLFYANVVTLSIMLIGALGVYLKIRKKEEIPCACLGVVFKIPMTHVTLFEDLLMAGMAITMLLV